MSKVIEIKKDSPKGVTLNLYNYRDKLVITIGFKSMAAAKRAEKSLLEMTWLVTAS